MVDRDPLPRWTHGPVTLLGDAAHPMYPIGSNGASQAILDARVLTGCLRHYQADLERGLERYDSCAARPPPRLCFPTANKARRPPCNWSKSARPTALPGWTMWWRLPSWRR